MKVAVYAQFMQYLQDELAIPQTSIEKALHSIGTDSHLLPIALWQYGLLTLKQLDQTCDWLAIAYTKQEAAMTAQFSKPSHTA